MIDRLILCLEFAEVDTDSFLPVRDNLTKQGFSFRSLKEEQARCPEHWLERFAEMDNACRTSDPFAPRTLDEIARRIADIGPEPVGCIVADDGARLIGYTCFHQAAGPDARRARQGWTGVRPEYRRMGVATVLKVEGILLARQSGYHRIVTDPRAENIASIRMSMRVGFRPCDTDAGLPPEV